MTTVCVERHIRETRRGVGPCRITSEVRKRNGQPNWWCQTHGMEAGAPDGAPLTACPGSWFEAVPEELQIDLDVRDGELAVWGVVPPSICIGRPITEPGKVHVHHRPNAGGTKDVDRSFDIVRVHNGDKKLVIEGIAAVAYSISELAHRPVKVLPCPRCHELHIDERKFATYPHRKHVCNGCGRNFHDSSGPSIGNPLAQAQLTLGLPPPAQPQGVARPLELDRDNYETIMVWPSNTAIVSTMSRSEEVGLHVHAWDSDGQRVVDETYSPVVLDGEEINEDTLRLLALQRALAHEAPIVSLPCSSCGTSLISPREGWIEPVTKHSCQACGETTKTRRRAFLNPLAEK